METLSILSIKSLNGGGSSDPQGINVGLVTSTSTSFPTQRPDGTSLKDEDYVKASGSSFPFTLNGVTFYKAGDKAYYDIATNTWSTSAGAIVNTEEVSLKNNEEKIVATNSTQSENNTSINRLLNNMCYTHLQTDNSKEWTVTHNLYQTLTSYGLSNYYHYPIVKVYDSSGDEIYGGVVKNITNNSLTISYDIALAGSAIVRI